MWRRWKMCRRGEDTLGHGQGDHSSGPNAVPLMSRGAITLLAIAQENDRHKKIADNEALRAALEYVARLVVLCSKENVSGVRSLLGLRELPANWFGFCVAIVDAIESR